MLYMKRKLLANPGYQVAAAVGAGVAVAGVAGSAMQADAASSAADAQSASAAAGVAEQRRQFDQVRQLLNPYVQAGTGSLDAQRALLGLSGNDAQQAAIAQLQGSPLYTSSLQAGQNAILQNASATGGLRGGNTQNALGRFAPQLLGQVIQSQLGNLGGITSLGQNAAAGVGNAGMQTGNNIANLLGQQGAAQAGGILAGGNAMAGGLNSIASGFGTYAGLGSGFGGTSGSLFGGTSSGGISPVTGLNSGAQYNMSAGIPAF